MLFLFFSFGLTAADIASCNTPGEAVEIYKQEVPKGYYNYEVVPEEPEKKEEEPVAQVQAKDPQAPPQYTYDQLFNMHPDKFQAYTLEITKWAVTTRDEKDVLQYILVQDVARRRSAAFASVVGLVGQKNAKYSNDDVYPVTAPGRLAITQNQLNEIDTTIESAKDEFALIMFSQQGCSFCTAQSSILKFFENNYRWQVRELDIQQYPELAIEYGVEQTPTLIIVHGESGETLPISTGVASAEEIRSSVYRAVRLMRGEIKPEQWNTYDFEKGSGNDPLKFMQDGKTKERGNVY